MWHLPVYCATQFILSNGRVWWVFNNINVEFKNFKYTQLHFTKPNSSDTSRSVFNKRYITRYNITITKHI